MGQTDWELGQRLIERGTCTLDQVREILSLQDRLRGMGGRSKPFARVLLEKGYARRDQLLVAGADPADLPAGIEESPGPSASPASPLPARRPARGRAGPLAAAAGILAALVLLILFARGSFSSGPTAEPPSAGTSEESRDSRSQSELEGIAASARGAPDFANAPDVVGRYESFERAHAGTRWEVEAHRRLSEYRDRIETLAKASVHEIEPEESSLRGQERWGELLALYRKFPQKFLRTTESGDQIQKKSQEISQRITAAYARERDEVTKLADAKKYSEALARVKSLELGAPPDRRDEILNLRARIERESRGAAERTRQEVADLYFKVDIAFKEAMLRRDGYRASRVVREFLVAPWTDEQRPFVIVPGVDYPAIQKAFDPWVPERLATLCDAAIPEVDSPDRLGTGEGALLALRNAAYMALFIRDETAQFHSAAVTQAALDLPGLGKGHFEKKNGKTVFLGENGAELEAETSPLTDSDLAALAMMVGPTNASMHARVGFFYFYSSPQRTDAAYEHLAKAYTLGARGVKMFLGGLAVAAEEDLKRQLETKFGAAQDLYREHKWPQVKRLLGELLQFPDHPYTRSIRPEVEKLMFEMAEGNDREKLLAVKYLGKVEVVDPTTLRVRYDFEGYEQQDAFEPVAEEGTRKFKGRWQIEHGALESGAESSVLRWKTRVKGDVTLDYELTPLDDPQNIAVDLYYNRGKSEHYAVVMGFDWVGKLDGDRDNTAEDRFGMPRTCVIKYPVSADKSRWMHADAWDGWKSRLVGTAVRPWKAEKGKTAQIRIERQGAALRISVDRDLVWQGEDEEYGEGQLLFYSDRRCRLDNLVITFKVQP